MGVRLAALEDVVIASSFWRGRRVLLTGHTGFKGAWTAMVLRRLGAEVYGLALPPRDDAEFFVSCGVEHDLHHDIGDIRDLNVVSAAFTLARPEVVLHMAAQSLVRESYHDPVATYATNVIGTVNILECLRQTPDIAAAIIVTSDKCYENSGKAQGYRETDPLGGHDPYSNSKACVELATSAYRSSFFSNRNMPPVATARAGNVIGGGDWARDRLVPDAIRAFLAGTGPRIRNPDAIRPWQHVVDPVIAYLMLAERLAEGGREFAEAWNFGPATGNEVSVTEICNRLCRAWGPGAHWTKDTDAHPHEAAMLKLDCTKAKDRLGWRPLLDLDRAISLTVDWYRAYHSRADIRAFTLAQISGVLPDAAEAA
jgi:CDP-glucose 4,6-dehydratase